MCFAPACNLQRFRDLWNLQIERVLNLSVDLPLHWRYHFLLQAARTHFFKSLSDIGSDLLNL